MNVLPSIQPHLPLPSHTRTYGHLHKTDNAHQPAVAEYNSNCLALYLSRRQVLITTLAVAPIKPVCGTEKIDLILQLVMSYYDLRES
jgi:hypothetical protein